MSCGLKSASDVDLRDVDAGGDADADQQRPPRAATSRSGDSGDRGRAGRRDGTACADRRSDTEWRIDVAREPTRGL